MSLLLSAALLVQVASTASLPDRQDQDTLRADTSRAARAARVDRDSVRAWRDSVANARALRRRAERARTLTPEVLRATFANDATRELYLRARAARLQQDSALISYDATTYQRVSAGLGFSRIGRDRLFFRHENAARVRWHRDRGAWVEVKGSRTVVPGLRGIKEAEQEMQSEFASEASPEMAPIPYYPGREGMWIGGGLAKAEVEDEEIVHPLAEGAETHYRFTAGDSMSIRTGDGKRFTIRELKVQARQPRWNLIVGSMWFDTESGRLVRAVYRLAEPLNAFEVAKEVEGEDPRDEIPIWVRPLVTPIVGSLDAVTVEYGLYEGRFWLPRVQRAEGHARVSFMRVPFTMEESYRYGSVNGRLDSLPILRTADEMKRMRDSVRAVADSITRTRRELRQDTTEAGRARLAAFDSLRRETRRADRERACADGLLTTNEERYEGAVRVSLSVPCDQSGLATSPELPASPYDPGDALFGSNELEELRKTALSLIVQPGFAPQRLELDYGVERWRYNRVEGFSPAASVRQRYGAGYVGELQARLGLADLQPNAELAIARMAGRRTVQVAAYRRLAAANDFGNPLGFGSSLAAALFGRDEGFYYRAAGAELQAMGEGNPFFTLRFFAERHDAAGKKTDLALPHLFNSGDFQDNIVADEGTVTGAGLRVQGSRGQDPQGFRLLGDLRAEGAGGAWLYGRALGDVTLSRGFGPRAAAALTLAGGMAGGEVPVQRQFFLGGSQTVRGQAPGEMRGDTFWMTRAEIGAGFVAARPTVFFDMGWAGDRTRWRAPGRPMSGAGIGASVMDGLFRFDLSRGIYPSQRTRLDAYVEARF